MRNLFFAGIATLVVVFYGPVRSDIPAAGQHNPPPSALVNDLGGRG